MIRASTPEDVPALINLTAATGVFKPLEIQALQEVFDDYFAANHRHGHRSLTAAESAELLGYAYFAPAAMTDRTWYLYWIAVRKDLQARGLGTALLRETEETIRQARGRLLLIETSSLPHYDLTRRFYHQNGYTIAAVLKDYYCDGDDMVVFSKRL